MSTIDRLAMRPVDPDSQDLLRPGPKVQARIEAYRRSQNALKVAGALQGLSLEEIASALEDVARSLRG